LQAQGPEDVVRFPLPHSDTPRKEEGGGRGSKGEEDTGTKGDEGKEGDGGRALICYIELLCSSINRRVTVIFPLAFI
jgi:hypothetical protein